MCRMFERAGEKPTSRELCNTDVCPIWDAEEEFSEVSDQNSSTIFRSRHSQGNRARHNATAPDNKFQK